MKKKRIALLLALCLVWTMLVPGALAADGAQTAAEQAQAQAELLLQAGGGVSAQYALYDDGQVTISGTAGVYSKEENRQLTRENMYGAGSVSKLFTTVAALQLVQQGKLDLDTPVTSYLPEFRMADERYKAITPRMLLNHSSGLNGSTFLNAFLLGDVDTQSHDTFLKQLEGQTLKADPGAYSVYCNDGFTLMELVIERVSGQDFTAYLHQNIMAPAGMKNTYTPMDSFDRNELAKAYSPFGNFASALPYESIMAIGAGGVYSTAEDLIRFATLFMGKQPSVLSPQMAAASMQKEYSKGLWPEEAPGSFSYGLGWDSVHLYPFSEYGIQALSKGGDTSNYHASLIVLPELNMAAAVLTSGGDSSTNSMLATQLLLRALQDKGKIKEITPPEPFPTGDPKPAGQELTALSGLYGSSTALYQLTVTPEGLLTLANAYTPDTVLERYQHQGEGVFTDQQGNIQLQFVREDNDQTYLWVRQYGSIEGLGTIASSQYTLQRLPENTLSADVQAVWDARYGAPYLLVDEKPSSVSYAYSLPMLGIAATQGYLASNRVVDANNAVSSVQIPGLGGRDTRNFTFYEKNGRSMVYDGINHCVDGRTIETVYPGARSICTIQEDGFSRWYNVGAAYGKTMTVTVPENAAFAVFDASGMAVFNSRIDGKTSVVLPENGVIVFVGAPKNVFQVAIQ